MTIAFDFDGTFMADPTTMAAVMDLLINAGHTVVVETNRGDHRKPTAEEIIHSALSGRVPVVRARDVPKEAAASLAGYMVDVWVDDEPWKIRLGPA